MMWWDGGWGPWGMLVGSVTMLVFWGLVIWGIVYAVRSLATGGRGTDQRTNERSARDILDERFARGEIDQQEYHARRDALAS